VTANDVAPNWHDLFRGAVRESLACAASVSRIGVQETRAWEARLQYVADDNQGNVGIVNFSTNGACIAVCTRESMPDFDLDHALQKAPEGARECLVDLCDLPLLRSDPGGVSAVYWSERDRICGSDQLEAFQAGLSLFQHELLSDEVWGPVAIEYFNISIATKDLAIAIAQRAVVERPIAVLSARELELIVPKGARYESDATDFFLSDRVFEVAP
jgi:hypothetical protein